MNFRLVANTTSYVLWVEAGFLLLPLAVSVFSGEAWLPFFITAVLCILIGGALHLVPVKKRKMHGRDGFMAVALGWIALSLTGALPYVLTGALDSYVDAVFETVSGLTTTGSTVFPEVEHLPYSVLLWRSLTQWMGGMGVLVLFLALMPKLGDGAVYLMRAESPGPIKSKLVPKVGSTAKILYGIYVALTVLEMACLRIAGLSWFSAVNHAFTTMATTGFATVDFALWPTFCRMALLVLMFTGGCAGSTSGGMKLSRVLILWKSLVRELKRMVHPNHVSVITVDGQPVEERVVLSTGAYIMAYMAVVLTGALVVSWDNYGFQESFAASLTCISNVGPGLGILGPMENFSILSPLSKLVLSLEMLTGRLELMPMLALMTRGAWSDR